MPLRYLEDRDYAHGMMRDEVSALLAQGELYDALNMLFDKPGIARTRGGTTAIFTGAQTAFAASLGWAYSQDTTPLEQLYGLGGDARLWAVNRTTGATTQVALAAANGTIVPGRAARFFGFVTFPYLDTGVGMQRGDIWMAGYTGPLAGGFNSTTNAGIAANDPNVSLAGPDVTTNIKPGMLVNLITTNVWYFGRVVSIVDATHFTVWPPPTITGSAVVACQPSMQNGNYGGVCAASFQNRLLYGNCNDIAAPDNVLHERRIYYSPLPTEILIYNPLFPTNTVEGIIAIDQLYWPALNFVDIPGTDPIVGMEPISDNELLILTSGRPVILRGNLITQQSTTAPAVTFDISDLDTVGGCFTDHAIQRTPRGIVWAGNDGIYCYNGGGSKPEGLLAGRMETYWRDLARSSTFAVHGSAYMRGHYLVTGTSGGSTFALLLNLRTKEPLFSRVSNVDIFSSVARPSDPAQVFAPRWYDVTAAAPSMTNGQVIRVESMLDLYTAGSTKTDADGAVVAFSVTTRVLAGDPSVQKIMQRCTIRYQAASPTANITVTAQTKIDASDIVAASVKSVGILSSTEPRIISAATTATPIACTTTVVHGLQTDDYVDINGGLVNTHVNGRWRVTVTGTTTFTLNGSSGNATPYTANSASMKRISAADYALGNMDAGQGISFVIASNGTVNNFELHGIRVAHFAEAQVMSA